MSKSKDVAQQQQRVGLLQPVTLRGRRLPLDARLWLSVRKAPGDACWEWIGALRDDGYGQIFANGRVVKPHRLALELELGRTFRPSEKVCHHCDNKLCCRPSHLFVGTQADNLADMATKGRRRSTGPLTPDVRAKAIAAIRSGLTLKEIAAHAGITRPTAVALRKEMKRGVA